MKKILKIYFFIYYFLHINTSYNRCLMGLFFHYSRTVKVCSYQRNVSRIIKKNNRKKGLNKQRGGWDGISPWYAHKDEDNKQRGVIIVRKGHIKQVVVDLYFLG